MRLKKLSLYGFKSFADKVALDFDCDVICIVGPNGCGKSNIVDAFRWVLGEQSAKSMRGDKMNDVVFAGSEHRKALNFAEVSVTFTEADQVLLVAYDELVITRRLYVSGESEYFINRKPARLKDIQEMLLGSGIGKNAFSVFEQGKLDQIIHLNPLDRRSIFDEAAGTSRFLQRKKECLKKLSQVSENYNRVKDIHVEVERQTRQLKKQAQAAALYQENKDHLLRLEKAVYVTKWRALQQKKEGLETEVEQLEEKIEIKRSEVQEAESSVSEAKKHLKEEEEKAKSEQKRLFQIQMAFQLREADIKQKKIRLKEMLTQKQSLLKEGDEGQKRFTERRDGIKTKTIDLEKLAKEKEEDQRNVQTKKELRDLQEKELQALRAELKKLQASQLLKTQEEGRLGTQLAQKRVLAESAQQKLKEKKEDLKRFEKEILEKRAAIEKFSQEIDAEKAGIEVCENDLKAILEKIESAKTQEKQLIQLVAEASAREKTLLRLREQLSKGTKRLLEEARGLKVQKLFEVFFPSEEMAPAFSAYADTLVVQSREDLKMLLTLAQKKQITDFSVLSLDDIEGSLEEHFLSGMAIADPWKTKKNGPFITTEGYYVDHRAVFFKVGEKENNTFLRESELKTLAKTLITHQQEQKETEKLLANLAKERERIEKNRSELLQKRQKKEIALLQENFILQRSLSDKDKCEKEIKIQEDKIEDRGEIAEFEKRVKELQQENERFRTEVLQTEKRHEEVSQKLLQAHQAWEEAQKQFQRGFSAWQKVAQDLRLDEAKEQENLRLQEKLKRDLTTLEEQIVKGEATLIEDEKEIEFQRKELEGLKGLVAQGEIKLKELRKENESSEQLLSKERSLFNKLEKERHRLDLLLAEDVSIHRGIEEELERLQVPLKEVPQIEIDLEGTLEEAEEKIRRLRYELEKTGGVNMTAIEEFKAQEERYQDLNDQLLDLEQAKLDLEKAVAKLDGESRKIFKKTFETIQANFRKNFQILFNGGEADLQFTDSSDVLEAGVEIIAKPPGKKMRAISLLSGGEKCLTALALLFSIFEVQPAPFCILDEVDAPLDESNIDRFINILKQFTPQTQFIIVSHNKKTMAIADLLVGVSMEEKGVSKLISLAFEKAAVLNNLIEA